MTNFAITRDNSGAVAYGLNFCDTNYYVQLAAGVEQTLTVPATTNYNNFEVIFSYTPGGSVWIADGSVAITLPTGAFTATSAQLNPSVRLAAKGDTLRFISPDAATCVGVSFYGIA